MQFPILSVIVFTPIVAGLLILLIPAERKTEIRVAALAAARLRCALDLGLFFLRYRRWWLPVHRKIYLAAGAGHLLPRRYGWDERSAGLAHRYRDVHRGLDLLGHRRPAA